MQIYIYTITKPLTISTSYHDPTPMLTMTPLLPWRYFVFIFHFHKILLFAFVCLLACLLVCVWVCRYVSFCFIFVLHALSFLFAVYWSIITVNIFILKSPPTVHSPQLSSLSLSLLPPLILPISLPSLLSSSSPYFTLYSTAHHSYHFTVYHGYHSTIRQKSTILYNADTETAHYLQKQTTPTSKRVFTVAYIAFLSLPLSPLITLYWFFFVSFVNTLSSIPIYLSQVLKMKYLWNVHSYSCLPNAVVLTECWVLFLI